MKKIVIGLIAAGNMSSCSVQQFAVNTNTEPFQNGGKLWGERVEKCGNNNWTSEFRKDTDIIC